MAVQADMAGLVMNETEMKDIIAKVPDMMGLTEEGNPSHPA